MNTVSNRAKFFPNVTDAEWSDSWKWQVRNRIETLDDLKKYINQVLKKKKELRKLLKL